jgi:hypothetical protein
VTPTATADRTTPTGPRLHQTHQRLVTAIQGAVSLNLAGLSELCTRLTVAISCDQRQAAELAEVRVCLVEIVEIGHPESANWARVGVERWDRAAEWDRTRDEHVCLSARLGSAIQRGMLRAARVIETLLTGRSE